MDGQKKARCTCDGSSRSGQVRVLDHTYANIATAENLILYGVDVSNAFAKASPPKQRFFVRTDVTFQAWWTEHK